MPTVDTSFRQPAPPERVTSPDGLLTLQVDAASASVLMWVDFSALSPQPTQARFYRSDGTLVRSGDSAWAPGGEAVAYDHEAPVGGTASYYAVPLVDGVEGAPTDTAAVAMQWSLDPSDVWLKSPLNPALSMVAHAATFEETARPARTTVTPISGTSLGISSWDVTGGLTATLTVKTNTKAEYDALLALLDGGPLLVQSHPDRAGIPPDWYCQPDGDVTSARLAQTGYGWDLRQWPLQLTQVRRPATAGAPLMIPGASWDSVQARYTSWDAMAAQVASWDALLGVS